MAAILFTEGEIKQRLQVHFGRDTGLTISLPEELGCGPAEIYDGPDLYRSRYQATSPLLSYCRELQVTLSGLIAATRFTCLEGGALHPVAFPSCGRVDSIEYRLRCVRIGPPPADPGRRPGFLSELARWALSLSAGRPFPGWVVGGAEIDLCS